MSSIFASLIELSDWMREHTGPRDGTHEMLVRAVTAIRLNTKGGSVNCKAKNPLLVALKEMHDALCFLGGGSIYLEQHGRLCFCPKRGTNPDPKNHSPTCNDTWTAFCNAEATVGISCLRP